MPTCDHTLMEASDGSLVYLAKRFDRVKGQKVHMEDFCQLFEFLTESKYKGSYEKIGKLILKYCTQTGFDALTYFELVLFSYLTGNNDMHLKNFSVLHTDQGVNLSPAYDLLNVNLVNPQDDEELALTLNGKKKKIKLADFDLLARSMNIPETAVSKLTSLTGISRPTVENYLDLLEQSYLIRTIPVLSYSPDREITKARKIYFLDNGIAAVSAQAGSGSLFENAVFNQLLHFGDIAYYQLKTGKEIDFILNKKMCFEVKETATEADLKNLNTISANIDINNNHVIGRHPVKLFDGFIWGGFIQN